MLLHHPLLDKLLLAARALEVVLAGVVLLQHLLLGKALLAACAGEAVLAGVVLLQRGLVEKVAIAGGAAWVYQDVRRHRLRRFLLRSEAAVFTFVQMRGGGHVPFQSFHGEEILTAVGAACAPFEGLFLESPAMLGRGKMLFQRSLGAEGAVAGGAADAVGVDGGEMQVHRGFGGEPATALGAGGHVWWCLLGREWD